jgi:uncharacterized protein
MIGNDFPEKPAMIWIKSGTFGLGIMPEGVSFSPLCDGPPTNDKLRTCYPFVVSRQFVTTRKGYISRQCAGRIHMRRNSRNICHTIIVTLIALAFLDANPAKAQTPPAPPPSAETLTAARELIQVTNATEQFKAVLPVLFQNLKAAVVQNRPEVEKQYDAMIPVFNQKAAQRLDELANAMATIYARTFTADELHDIAAFYRSPTGQKFIARQQSIVQQSMALGQQFGREVANDVQQEINGQH